MARKYERRVVKCPYYRGEAGATMYCESLLAGAETQRATFDDGRKLREWQRVCCSSMEYEKCPHAETLARMYAEGKKKDPD